MSEGQSSSVRLRKTNSQPHATLSNEVMPRSGLEASIVCFALEKATLVEARRAGTQQKRSPVEKPLVLTRGHGNSAHASASSGGPT